MTREHRGKPSIYAGYGGIPGGTGPLSINNNEREGVGGGRRLFSCTGRHRRPRTAAAAARQQLTKRYEKPPEALKNRQFRGFFCSVLERGAAPHRPGSHSSRPKRAGFAAHEYSIADRRQHGKRARRANEALQRAKIDVDPRISGVCGADQRGRRR